VAEHVICKVFLGSVARDFCYVVCFHAQLVARWLCEIVRSGRSEGTISAYLMSFADRYPMCMLYVRRLPSLLCDLCVFCVLRLAAMYFFLAVKVLRHPQHGLRMTDIIEGTFQDHSC
jgi:hypothetical protein